MQAFHRFTTLFASLILLESMGGENIIRVVFGLPVVVLSTLQPRVAKSHKHLQVAIGHIKSKPNNFFCRLWEVWLSFWQVGVQRHILGVQKTNPISKQTTLRNESMMGACLGCVKE